MRFGLKLLSIVLLVFLVTVGCVNTNGRHIPPSLLQSISINSVEYTAYGDAGYVTVFVLERATSYLVPVSLSKPADVQPIDYAIAILNGDVEVPGFRTFGTVQARIERASFVDGLVTLEMPSGFQSWVMRNLVDERNFVQATVLTLTGFVDVEAIQFFSNGREVHGTVFVYPMDRPILRPQVVNTAPSSGLSAILYVRLRSANLLVPYTKLVERRDPLWVLNELFKFKGSDNLVSPIPGTLIVKGLRIEDGTALLNLDKSAVTHIMQGALDEQLVLDAIVHTLLEFSEIRQVQILIDGRVLGPLSTNIDLSRAIGKTPINQLIIP
ncbi:MAG: lipoprotein LpqB GerMN domain-containing protein [Bacillota bacterium]|nr:MAG: lipoprotein LpqB GerMN domain-containing protein [Bacillota bacterium]MBS3949236.1 GerMN domain-containing protein [Peptococcaceae bacterium]